MNNKNKGGTMARQIDYPIAVGAVSSPAWLDVASQISTLASCVAAVGGVILLVFRIAIAYREWRHSK